MSVAEEMALATLSRAMRNDDDYARAWHDNLACCALDEGVDHATAQRIAVRAMQVAFKVDTSEHAREVASR